tara:strand:- start:579 stop:830 length:252 start_codon:yes stop_codon:yes gene_type:complete
MASKNTSVALGEPFIKLERRKVESGEFATTSEVVREAMRRYIAYDDRVEVAARNSERHRQRPPPLPFEWDAFMERKFGPESDV